MGEHGQRRRAVPTSPSASDSAGNVYITDPGFVSPIGVATDAADDLYVADTNNNRIQKFGTAPPTGDGLDGGAGTSFANAGEDLHAVGSLAPLADAIGCIVIKSGRDPPPLRWCATR
jgi:hypothetical protein